MLTKFKKNAESGLVVAPYVNIYEQGTSIIVDVEMPGVDKSTLSVNIKDNQLSISGKKIIDELGKEYKLIYQERTPVTYQRDFDLNTEIDREKIEAKYENGILKIALQKSAEAQPKRIEIKI